QLPCQSLSESAEREFSAAESDGAPANRRSCASEQEATGVLFKHLGDNRLRAEERSQNADFPTASKALWSNLHQGLTKRTAGTGIVNQKINRAQSFADAFERRRNLFGLADVHRNGEVFRSVAAKLGG